MQTEKRKVTVYDRALKIKPQEISLSAFSFLISESVQYSQNRSKGIPEFEKRLSDLGYAVGVRCAELTADRGGKRDLRVIQLLQLIHTTLWVYLFNKKSDALERSTENEDEYMICDNEPQLSKFITVPKEMGGFHCGGFVAGIIEAVCDGSGFHAKVSAHGTRIEGFPTRVTYLIKFDASVMARDKLMS